MNRAPRAARRERPRREGREVLGRRFALALLGAVVTAHGARCTVHGVQVKPVISAQVLGGQYFYKGRDSAFGALASLSASPYLELNDRWSLVPLYSGHYRGTKQVTDLVGGGTLFQDSQDHAVSLKVIRSFRKTWKVKAVGGYGTELLRETVDEDWGDGLYDNRRISGGAEVEWLPGKGRSLRLAYDYYAIRFPNYASLESQGTPLGLGRELNAPDVLDTGNHALTLAGQARLPANGQLDAMLNWTRRGFGSQHIVNDAGELTADTREDALLSAALEGTWPVWVRPGRRLFGSLGGGWTRLRSNQNHYDAERTFFNPDYYGFTTQSVHLGATLMQGDDPWNLQLKGSLSRQAYAARRIQDGRGNYGADTTDVDSAYVTLTFSYPIAKGFRLSANTAFGWNDSNNQFNEVYQYHYNTQTYLMGFSYAY